MLLALEIGDAIGADAPPDGTGSRVERGASGDTPMTRRLASVRLPWIRPSRVDRPIVPAAGHDDAAVDLYWLPLGAGGHFVRMNGVVYEALAARAQRRATCELYHSALEVKLPAQRYVIEMAPIFQAPPEQCGVVAIGPVGASWLGRLRLFQYGIRRWLDGEIPDVAEAVDSPVRLTSDIRCVQRLLDLVPQVPTAVWGRNGLDTGDMWNSNSLIAWLIARSGIDVHAIQPPAGGRAPGWTAGLVVASRQKAHARAESAEASAYCGGTRGAAHRRDAAGAAKPRDYRHTRLTADTLWRPLRRARRERHRDKLPAGRRLRRRSRGRT